MLIFTIDAQHRIRAWAGSPPKANGVLRFTTERSLAELTSGWPALRLVAVWNTLPGVTPVSRFSDRKAAVARIWKQVQNLPTSPRPSVAPKASRIETKTAAVLGLLRRPEGATIGDIITATGWQPHTVRGFISGTLAKKMGLAVESLRGEEKVRSYRIGS